VRTTFASKSPKRDLAGVPGSYSYVWMSGDDTLYHLSKKVAAQGRICYLFLEDRIRRVHLHAVDILKATLGRP